MKCWGGGGGGGNSSNIPKEKVFAVGCKEKVRIQIKTLCAIKNYSITSVLLIKMNRFLIIV